MSVGQYTAKRYCWKRLAVDISCANGISLGSTISLKRLTGAHAIKTLSRTLSRKCSFRLAPELLELPHLQTSCGCCAVRVRVLLLQLAFSFDINKASKHYDELFIAQYAYVIPTSKMRFSRAILESCTQWWTLQA